MAIGNDNVDNVQEVKGGLTTGGPQELTSFINYDQLRLIQGDGYGTSGYGVTYAPPIISSPHEHEQTRWAALCESSSEYDALLAAGIEYLKKEAADLNSLNHLLNRDVAVKAIGIGSTLMTVKSVSKKAGHKWGDWTARNLTFMSVRNIQKYMLLAERVDCHPYAMLGVDRLDTLCSATKTIKGADPIGSFLNKHGITFDPTLEYDLDDFKLIVDVALNKDRLEKHGVQNPDPGVVKALTRSLGKFDGAMLRDLKNIQNSGGDVNSHLRRLGLTKGQDSSASEEEQRPKDFNNMSGKLIRTIDYILRDEEQIDKVDVETFKSLFQKLRILGRAKFGQIEEETI